MPKSLVVFDFDHTIVDDNSDTAMIGIIGKNNIPHEVKELQHREGWTAFMQGIFHLLHENGVQENMIKEHIVNLPSVNGVLNLITELKKAGAHDVIIISDCNSYFIKVYLEKHNLDKAILRVFTNPADFVDGLLTIEPYHDQTTCKLSTRNLCKGQILDEFVEEQRQNGVIYDQVIYVGDGVNDFCPILRLGSKDLICARNNFKLRELVLKAKSGKSLDHSGNTHVVKADLVIWENGDDILQKIKK